jgi:hypothetical protein
MGHGSLGLGESYMEGWWDANVLDEFLVHLMQAHLDERVHGWREVADALKARLFNLQAGRAATKSVAAITTSATISTRPCSASAWSTAAATGATPMTSTPRRRPSSTWSAASWACARASACWTSAAVGAKP